MFMGLVRERLLCRPPAFCPVQQLVWSRHLAPGPGSRECTYWVWTQFWVQFGAGFPFFPQVLTSQRHSHERCQQRLCQSPVTNGDPVHAPISHRILLPRKQLAGDHQPLLHRGRGRLQPEPILPPGIPVLLGTMRHAPGCLCACLFHFSLLSFIWHFTSLEPGRAGAQTVSLQGYGTK